MPKTIWHITMSVDGFIARPDDHMARAFRVPAHGPLADEMGRRPVRSSAAGAGGTARWPSTTSDDRPALPGAAVEV